MIILSVIVAILNFLASEFGRGPLVGSVKKSISVTPMELVYMI